MSPISRASTVTSEKYGGKEEAVDRSKAKSSERLGKIPLTEKPCGRPNPFLERRSLLGFGKDKKRRAHPKEEFNDITPEGVLSLYGKRREKRTI